MLLPAIVLMPSPNHSYNVNTHTYTSDGNGLIYNAAAADIGGLTAFNGVVLVPRNNTSLVDPTAADDYTHLYGVGSLWENTVGIRLWMCTAMGSTPGTATWTQIAANAGVLSGDGSGVTVIPTGASTPRTLANLFADAYNNVKTFGAIGNGSTDDTAAINAAITEAGLNGQPVYFPTGVYKVTSQIAVDLTALGSTSAGMWFVGDGMNRSIIDGSATGGFTPFYLFGSGGTPLSQTNIFFGGIRDLGIKANYAGPALQIGTTNYADALNGYDLSNINVKNTSSSSSAIGTRFGYFLNSNVRNLVSNCAGAGDALFMGQVAFVVFVGGSFSSAQNGIHFSNDFNFSNVFLGPDIEVVTKCILIDGAHGSQNTITGAQFVWTGAYAISSTAGDPGYLHILNSNFGSHSLYSGLALDPSNQKGVSILGNYGDGSTPAGGAPVSGTEYFNTTGQAQQVIVYPGTGTTGYSVQLNQSASGPVIGGLGTPAPVTIILRPGYSVTVTWATTQAAFLWIPLPT